ncbi:MAG TPA: beta-ketoacyl-[acyl-carrier-protein] synthase family protein, partial [Pirellulales bacterium]
DVPVTAPKSFFGNLGGGTGAVELLASMYALQHGRVPHTLNYEYADPECAINVVQGSPLEVKQRTALMLNQTTMGQSVAMVLSAE